MKLTNVKLEDENGAPFELLVVDYHKHMVAKFEVKEFVSEASGTTPPIKISTYVLRSFEEGKEIDEAIASAYPELVRAIEEDYKRTEGAKVDKKAEAEAKKLEADKAKAEKEKADAEAAEKLKLIQHDFATTVSVGVDTAASEFVTELETLRSSLPEGVSVVAKGAGFGLDFGKDATKETIASTLGYLQGKAANSQFLLGQIQFWIGDTISAAVEAGIYASAKEAGVHIAAEISKATGKTFEAPSLEQYKRMAERTPVEMRNPLADPTAYLAIAGMKIPRKDAKETDEHFKARLGAFEKDRLDLQSKLATGEILKRKDILVPVNDTLIKHGLREKVDPNAPVIRVSDQLLAFFHSTVALDNLLGVHKKDVIIYKDGAETRSVTKEEMEEVRATALSNLLNLLYNDEKLGITPADFLRGYIEKKENTKVATGADGKDIMEEKTVRVPVYPPAFYESPKKEEAPAAEGTQEVDASAEVVNEAPAEAEAAAEPKKGKGK